MTGFTVHPLGIVSLSYLPTAAQVKRFVTSRANFVQQASQPLCYGCAWFS